MCRLVARHGQRQAFLRVRIGATLIEVGLGEGLVLDLDGL
jgi:hypothetical protein